LKIVLASHSNLALGMKDTVELIMGRQEQMSAIAAYVDDAISFKDQLAETIAPFQTEKILFITDLLGGSVNNLVSGLVKENDHYFLITGMNLPLILELLSGSFEGSNSEIAEQLTQVVTNSLAGIQYISLSEEAAQEDEF
jgi:fructoselysine and glucoselysine-specific PTS system IIA component